MGKSTTAKMFADLGCVVWDADAAVHRLYDEKGSAIDPIGALYPSAIIDNKVSREQLKKIIAKDPQALAKIEAIVHPLVQTDREGFVNSNPDKIGVFDIPLLFETRGDKSMNATACVSVTPEIQRKRVLERGTMNPQTLDQILSRQMPNDTKCARSTYVIVTDNLEHAHAQVAAVVQDIERQLADA